MTIEKIIERAKELAAINAEKRQDPAYEKVVAWFCYLGLLRNNRVTPKRHQVTLAEVLKAGQVEPRLLELLPALLLEIPEALTINNRAMPQDLRSAVDGLRRNKPMGNFRGVAPDVYKQWVGAPCMDVARRRLNFRTSPRSLRSDVKTTQNSLAETIRQGRLAMSMTQLQFSEKFGVSLSALRNLEKGKMTAAIGTVDMILKSLGKQLRF